MNDNHLPRAAEGIGCLTMAVLIAVSAAVWYGIYPLIRWLLP